MHEVQRREIKESKVLQINWHPRTVVIYISHGSGKCMENLQKIHLEHPP